MGYSTTFEGVLRFKDPVTNEALGFLNTFLGKDRRDIGFKDESVYQGGKYGSYWYYIDFQLTDDFTGIKWNESEKAYDMEHIANWLTDMMRPLYPDFEFEGELLAIGEEQGDVWKLVMEDGIAVKKKMAFEVDSRIKCPDCGHIFKLQEQEASAHD